jgi:hypothetical protein
VSSKTGAPFTPRGTAVGVMAQFLLYGTSSARSTFCIAVSRVNGGKGGRAGVDAVPMISSPGLDSFGISINSCTRAAISLAAVSREMAAVDNVNLR